MRIFDLELGRNTPRNPQCSKLLIHFCVLALRGMDRMTTDLSALTGTQVLTTNPLISPLFLDKCLFLPSRDSCD
jgi:hypothetical protein